MNALRGGVDAGARVQNGTTKIPTDATTARHAPPISLWDTSVVWTSVTKSNLRTKTTFLMLEKSHNREAARGTGKDAGRRP